jgi:hypothetical protein
MRPDEHPDRNCAHGDPEAWFPPPGNISETRRAKALCNGCPVIAECLEQALRFEAGFPSGGRAGIWGGTTPAERVDIAAKRRIAGPRQISHGTEVGYKAHRRRGEEPCTACRSAANAARRRRELSA